mmetsp:Transcript_11092/g.14438  ORF Transcript_11092/g.14438 Transcript_11092/m.14438 type:complete len:382 (+) Transcript_11092:363-1508(+)
MVGSEMESFFLNKLELIDRISDSKVGAKASEEDIRKHAPTYFHGNVGIRRKRSLAKAEQSSNNGQLKVNISDNKGSPGSRITRHGHGHDEHTKVRNINKVQFGEFEIDCWYYSPYPGEYSSCNKLFVCEKTFKYMKNPATYKKHLEQSKSLLTPPGREIYRDNETMLSVYEIDGAKDRLFGQNLCLFSKLFIEHKTLCYDPNPFFFYVMIERDKDGEAFHPVGYFSKEKNCPELYNLACILIFPPHQRKGYGKFIISLSYEISKRQKTVGSPEKPISDLGKLSYRSYWSYVLLNLIHENKNPKELALQRMAETTSIKVEDILSTLQHLRMIKHLKGQFVIHISKIEVEKKLNNFIRRKYASSFCKPEKLTYKPAVQNTDRS